MSATTTTNDTIPTSTQRKTPKKRWAASEFFNSPVFQDKTKPNIMVYCYCDKKGLVCTCIIG